jgi:DNA-binding transcriptional regulator YiaG
MSIKKQQRKRQTRDALPATVETLVARARLRGALPPPEERARIRLAAGCTLGEVGDVIGVSHEAVRTWELGIREPGPENARRYGELLERLQGAHA